MLPFKEKDADLYSRYESARQIFDKGGSRNSSSEAPATDAGFGGNK